MHVETLSTIAWAATDALNLTGNSLANTIHGNAGANVLDGVSGIDRLVGNRAIYDLVLPRMRGITSSDPHIVAMFSSW